MPARIQEILCSVERIPTLDLPREGVKTHLGFGLNLSVAWSEDTGTVPADEPARLKPWLWPKIMKLRYAWVTAGSAPVVSADELTVLDSGILHRPENLSTFTAVLDTAFTDALVSRPNVVYDVPSRAGESVTKTTFKDTTGNTKRPWHALLHHVSTFPYPLPQSHNLSRVFRVPAPSGDTATNSLLAAPIVEPNGSGFPRLRLVPDGTPALGSSGTIYSWDYSGAETIAIKAVLAPCAADAPPDKFINLGTQWVTNPGTASGTLANVFDEDWQTRLEIRMADAFSLPPIITGLVRGMRTPDLKTLRILVSHALVSIFDVAGPGLVPGPDGIDAGAANEPELSVAGRIFEAYAKSLTLTPMEWQRLQRASEAIFPTLVRWRKLLRDTFTEIADIEILQDNFPNGYLLSQPEVVATLPTKTATELDRLTSLAFDSNRRSTLWVLLRAVWDELLTGAALPEEKNRMIKDALRNAGSSDASNIRIDLPRQLALSNIGRLWRPFIRSNRLSNDADPKGHALIKNCFPAYLKEYAHQRLKLTPNPVPTYPDVDVPASASWPAYKPETDWGDATTAEREQLSNQILMSVDGWATENVKRLLPELRDADMTRRDPAGGALDESPRDVPHAVTLQVGRLTAISALGASAADDPNDPLRHISGVGVIMQEAIDGARWRLLNLADVYAKAIASALELRPPSRARRPSRAARQTPIGSYVKLNPFSDDKPVLVPYRVSYRGGLRQVCVSYNNQPIIADSPLSNKNMTGMQFNAADAPSELSSLARYSYSLDASAIMPALKYGKMYNFAFFAIRNSGALPLDMSVTDVPCRLDHSQFSSSTQRFVVPSSAIRQLIYKRKVRIGALRLSDVDAHKSTTGLLLPRIPASVTPRARDIPPNLLLPNPDPGERVIADDLPSTERGGRLALLMLAKNDWRLPGARNNDPSTFEFHVRRPGTNWECWDRWVMGQGRIVPDRPMTAEQLRQARKDVLADYYRLAKKENRTTETENDVRTPDDPALAYRLFFKVEGPGETSGVWKDAPVMPADGAVKIKLAQAQPVKVKCQYDSALSTRFDYTYEPGTGDQEGFIRVRVKPGEVCRLTICASVPAQYEGGGYLNYFEDAALNIYDRATSGGAAYLLVSPAHLVIEAATDVLPTSDQLWSAFSTQFSFETEKKNWQVNVALNSTDPEFRNLHRVELQRQTWRWLGRESAIHPDLQVSPGITVEQWEAIEFGDRPETDYTLHEMGSERADDGRRKFSYKELIEENTVATFEESASNVTHDQRNQYFRFALRAFSRYEALFPVASQPYRDASERRDSGRGDRTQVENRWRGQLAPRRSVGDIEPPKVRLILPLTELDDAPGTTPPSISPGLLVVLDEPWHEIGGIGETLEAEVAVTPVTTPGTTSPGYFQVGPDPIITSSGRLPAIRPGGSTSLPLSSERIRGPVGHYFDRSNASALFVGTSFILPPPTASEILDPGWYFAKLRLRRVVPMLDNLTGGTETNRIVYESGAGWRLRKLYSPFTEPFWVQYLPPFSIFSDLVDRSKVDLNTLKVDVTLTPRMARLDGTTDPEISKLVLLKRVTSNVALKPVRLEPQPRDGAAAFALYVVLTRLVFDVTGREGQEQYIGLFRQRANSTEWEKDENRKQPLGLKADDHFRARVIEVQRPTVRPTCPTGDSSWTLWDELFGRGDTPDHSCDARARIVRMSAPMERKGIISECIDS